MRGPAALTVLLCSWRCAAPSSTPPRFLVIGDWGGLNNHRPCTRGQKANAGAMAAVARERGGAAFVLTLGDNFYNFYPPRGSAPGSAQRQEAYSARFRQGFEEVFSQPELQVPWYITTGNHDYWNPEGIAAQQNHSSPRWRYPRRTWYNFSYTLADGARLAVVVLDTFPIVKAAEPAGSPSGEAAPLPRAEHRRRAAAQLRWAETALRSYESAGVEWIFVTGHHPVYSSCVHGPTSELRLPGGVHELLERFAVTAFLSGHNHCQEYIRPRGGRVAYVVSGAGRECCNSPLRDVRRAPPEGALLFAQHSREKHGSIAGFAEVDLGSVSGAVVRFYGVSAGGAERGRVLFESPPLSPRRGP